MGINEPLNTPQVATTGLTTLVLGLVGQLVLNHAFPHAPLDVHDALQAFFSALIAGGGYASYKGMPRSVAAKRGQP